MSYKKAMKHARNPRKGRNQYLGFSTLGANERRKEPWLGSVWFKPGMDEEREKYIEQYHAETERLLRENPNLDLVD